MATARAPGHDLLVVARDLAASHRANDPSLRAIYYAADPNGREVRLVEVSAEVGTTGEVFPVRFSARPDLGLPVPCVVVLLSPSEWASLEKGELALPLSWEMTAEKLQLLAA